MHWRCDCPHLSNSPDATEKLRVGAKAVPARVREGFATSAALGIGTPLSYACPMHRWTKRWRVTRRAVSRGLSLSARFLVVATLTVAVATVLLGFLITRFLESGILDGVARTASASIEAII